MVLSLLVHSVRGLLLYSLLLASMQGVELQPEHTLVSLGLTSLDGMTVMELVAHRTGRILEPEEVEVW